MRNCLYSNSLYTDTISYYDSDGKDNHTFNHFHLASGMTLSTIKDAIFNIVRLIYVGTCYKPNSSFDVFTVAHVFFTVTHIPFRHELKWRCSSTSTIQLSYVWPLSTN